MKRFTISDDLMRRIKVAAANGNVVANDLMLAIKQHRDKKEETDKTIDYFDSVRKVATCDGRKSVRIVVSCCRKDLSNPNFPDYGNPQAPYMKENRDVISMKDFALLFKAMREKTYTDVDWMAFDSCVRVGEKVRFRVGTTVSDFMKAYDGQNYSSISESGTSTLHGSCMRGEETTRAAADYYVNFAGAKILIGETESGEIVSRALLWDDVDVELGGGVERKAFSFIDRVYTSFDGWLLRAMYAEATRLGYMARKTHNDYCHKNDFTALRDLTFSTGYEFQAGTSFWASVERSVPSVKWHKKGAPYCDTFSWVLYQDMKFSIANHSDSSRVVADVATTGGTSTRLAYICPFCGKRIGAGTFCHECESKYVVPTDFGNVLNCGVKTYKGKKVPSPCLTRTGKPTEAYANYLALEKLFTY